MWPRKTSAGRRESEWGSLTVSKMPTICLAVTTSFYPEGHLAWQAFSHLWIGDPLIYLFILIRAPLPVPSQHFFNPPNWTNCPVFYYIAHATATCRLQNVWCLHSFQTAWNTSAAHLTWLLKGMRSICLFVCLFPVFWAGTFLYSKTRFMIHAAADIKT